MLYYWYLFIIFSGYQKIGAEKIESRRFDSGNRLRKFKCIYLKQIYLSYRDIKKFDPVPKKKSTDKKRTPAGVYRKIVLGEGRGTLRLLSTKFS